MLSIVLSAISLSQIMAANLNTTSKVLTYTIQTFVHKFCLKPVYCCSLSTFSYRSFLYLQYIHDFVFYETSYLIFPLRCHSCLWSLFPSMQGYRLRVVCCLVLPAVQLASGISNPSWLSLPFFICSCVGLVDWSLTSNFLGLFR